MQNPIAGVMIHVANVAAGLTWYQRAFPRAIVKHLADHNFTLLVMDGVQIEISRSDELVGSGPSGTVVYWAVANLDDAIAHFDSLGAPLYRGPMDIDGGMTMCQVRDPWGNCIGLRGGRALKE